MMAHRRKLIGFACILIIVGTAIVLFVHGIGFPAKDIPENQKIVNAHFEIQEWDFSSLRNRTIIPVTYDELKDFPDFERSMHDVINGSGTWAYGHRVVAWFDGNESDLYQFYHIACKNETRNLADCYPYPPVFEYHGQYYTISSNLMGYHRLAGCERGNYNCTDFGERAGS